MGFNFVKFVTLLKTELRVESFLLLLFFEVCGKSAPRKLYWYGTLVDYFIVLVGEESDRGGVGRDLCLGEIDVIVVRFAEGGDGSLERVIAENKLFLILARLGGFEVEYELLDLSDLKYALALADLEAGWGFYMPLSGLFANVSEYDRFLVVVLHGHQAKVELVREVEDSSAAHCADGHNKLLALSNDH